MSKLLLIGCGRWGTNLLQKLNTLVGCRNLYLADLDRMRINYYANNWNIDYRAFLDKVDACIVATPPITHYAIARDCLLHGKHVLVEKPVTLDPKSTDDLVEIASTKKLTLMADSTWEYHPVVLSKIQPAHSLSLFWGNPKNQQTNDSILWTNGPHPIALMLRVFHDMPTDYDGYLSRDEVDLRYGFRDGSICQIFMTWKTQKKERFFSLRTKENELVHFSDNETTPLSEDALTLMCKKFLSSLQYPYIDSVSQQVVHVLARTERELL